jgi:hypothetical protein
VRIPLAPPLIRHLSVVYPPERIQAKIVEDFVRFAKERLAASRGESFDARRRRAVRIA